MAVRVTRQVVEVLTLDNLEQSLTSTLSLTQEAKQLANNQSASSTLSLTGTAEDNTIQIDIQNQLNLTQSATNNIKFVSASNVLSLIDLAERGQDILQSLSNTLALIDSANQNQKVESVANILNLQQSIILVTNNDVFIEVESSLSLTDTAQLGNRIFNRTLGPGISDPDPLELIQTIQLSGIRSFSISDLLTFTQQISINKNVTINLTSFLSLAQEVGRVFDLSAANILDLVQVAERIFSVSSVLNLTQAVIVQSPKEAENTFSLVQAINLLAEFTRSASNTLGLSQTVGLRFATIDTCQYDPQVGTGGFTTTDPTFGIATLTLTHPFVTPTTTLVLRNPNFGNTENFQFSRINRESRGGTLLVFRDPTWPKREALAITVDFLKQQQKLDLLAFFQTSLGQEIGLLDNENRQWKGIIVNPDSEVTHVGKDNYSVTFEFEGEIQ